MGLRNRLDRLHEWWTEARKTSVYHTIVLYLVFVVIATLFWFMMTLNDSVQDNVEVDVHIYNVPDSVTFIDNPPTSLHVDVRDKGTQLLRKGWLRHAQLQLNFREFASNGVFRLSSADLYSALRKEFGSNALISSVSVDSLHIEYTSAPGKRVPVVVVCEVVPSSGYVLAGRPKAGNGFVTVYTRPEILDTITRVFTKKIVLNDVSESVKVETPLRPVNGVRIEPSTVLVTIPIETLVSKTAKVPVTVKNAPDGVNVLLFPDKVGVTYFTPMSKFNETDEDIVVSVDYDEIKNLKDTKVKVYLDSWPPELNNVTLNTDSVEYTLIR